MRVLIGTRDTTGGVTDENAKKLRGDPPWPVMADAKYLDLLPLLGVQPTWRDMLLPESRSKMTHLGRKCPIFAVSGKLCGPPGERPS